MRGRYHGAVAPDECARLLGGGRPIGTFLVRYCAPPILCLSSLSLSPLTVFELSDIRHIGIDELRFVRESFSPNFCVRVYTHTHTHTHKIGVCCKQSDGRRHCASQSASSVRRPLNARFAGANDALLDCRMFFFRWLQQRRRCMRSA
jgi:hypothetical protein